VFVNGVRLHYVELGQGPLVVLLHGFPEFWYSWRRQLPVLAAAGFRAVALDLRGYNESDCPNGVHRYRTATLVDDVAGVIRRLGEPAFVIGHDWGGVLAWRLASLRPELVRKLAILNAPPPATFREECRRNPVQCLRSWYMLFFQFPWLPEWLLRAGNFALLERAWRKQLLHPGAFTDDDIAEYKRAFNRPGRLTAAINYYRAAARWPQDLSGFPQTFRVPTLLIWGERDSYLSATLPDRAARWVADLRIERIADASHWVQNDAPERVNHLLVDFLTR
jgi:pimeloyl-ACP methyl ester carboxylesterase